MMLDNEDDVWPDSPAAERKPSQASSDLEASFKATGVTLREVVVNPEGQGTKDGPEVQALRFVREDGHFRRVARLNAGIAEREHGFACFLCFRKNAACKTFAVGEGTSGLEGGSKKKN